MEVTMSTYGELFAGVGGMTMGFERAGFEPLWHVEIDKYCQSVLRHHWPDVPVYDDVRTVNGGTAWTLTHRLRPVDVIAFGSPCQDLSQAGKRRGLVGNRSGLFHEAIRIIKEMRDVTDGAQPRWAVWENVGGALNSHGGADFGAALDALADAGALVIEWAQLDLQFFGVPHRRERVFVVACFDPAAAERCPAELLALAESSPWNPRSRGKTGYPTGGAPADGAALYVAGEERDRANCLTARQGKGVPTWMDDGGVVVYARGMPVGVLDGAQVRRLAPIEAERLMGWPDNHTAQGDQGKISDTQRGKMIGNGVATPVAEFIARSIKEAD
jgi:DNA (cytosine-5)-methyltransferase 1